MFNETQIVHDFINTYDGKIVHGRERVQDYFWQYAKAVSASFGTYVYAATIVSILNNHIDEINRNILLF